jgi:Uncharacterised nucleotidyltransferase
LDELNSTVNLWPTTQQRLLLTAALADGQVAIDAFRAWRAGVNLDDNLDRGSFRLLPMLFHNMRRLDVRDPLMGRLRGMYRLAWYENHVLFDEAKSVVAALEDNGIATLLVKGVPLTFIYYRNHALRPMADVDIVVRRGDVRRALALLDSLGWRRSVPLSDDDLEFRHAIQLFGPKNRELDLHWHVLYEANDPAADEHFWSGAQPFDFAGVDTRTLDPTDALLHVVVHGVRWNAEPPTRWVVDAMAIMRGGRFPPDWKRMLRFAERWRLTHRLGLGLAYLAEHHAAPIPADVLGELRSERPSIVERIEDSVVLRNTERIFDHAIGKQWVIFAEYCRKTTASGPIDFIVGLSHYLRYRWGLRGRSEIIPSIVGGLKRYLLARRS